jgi:hypothetical protein
MTEDRDPDPTIQNTPPDEGQVAPEPADDVDDAPEPKNDTVEEEPAP